MRKPAKKKSPSAQDYQQKLENLGEVDFEDLIIDAANRVADEKYSNSYRLILVDEFQDISKSRAKLLQAFLKTSPSCKLFAVGDDWQSIYRFAGADISIFTEFPKTFGYTSTNFLSETFRSNQGIADVAARFIQCNPSQMTKSIQAKNKITKDVIKVHLYTKLEEIDGLLEIALKEIADANFSSAQASVYILGRYRYQVPVQLANWQKKFASKLTIEYKTIHSSKGKQADYVFLIGLHSGKNAFPSEIADDPLLQLVMPNPEQFSHAEERRLFYVALTRAKHAVYLFGGKHTPSAFLTELQAAEYSNYIVKIKAQSQLTSSAHQCPKCKLGQLQMKNGKYGQFYGCTEYPACNYTINAVAKNTVSA